MSNIPSERNPVLCERIKFTGALRLSYSIRLIAFLCGASFMTTVAAQSPPARTSSPTTADVAEKRGDLKELRGQIETLRKEMAKDEGKRAGAADQLKDVEREISATQREMHNLGTQRSRLQTTLGELGRQSAELEERLERFGSQLEQLAYRQYLKGHPDTLRLLLNGEDPNQLARDLYYLGTIGRARSQVLRETETLLERKKALAENIRERAEELASVEARQKEQHVKLVAQREQRKAVLEKISARIVDQRKEIGNLQRDEKQLSQLIARLNRIIASRPTPRRDTPARPAPAEKRPAGGEKPTELANEATPEAMPAGSFAALRGNLRLPVKGVVTNRFGSARQEGSTWKGLFIRAALGSDIKAIAGGRVVFADWMRGFGNLLIVDHGGNYLSIYGYNDAMLKQVGDSVRGGDSIATAGNSGGNPESGLYFELRHQGLPIDPMRWVNLR